MTIHPDRSTMRTVFIACTVLIFAACGEHQQKSNATDSAEHDRNASRMQERAENDSAASEVTLPDERMIVNREFDLQGHRGARGIFPENSLEGFISAVDLMVNTVEMDVVISADGQVVVSHEPWISSTICTDKLGNELPSGKQLNIYHMSYAKVRSYDCGSQEHPDFPLQAKIPTYKPLLSEVIDAVEQTAEKLDTDPLTYNIEIKSSPETDGVFHPAPEEFCRAVLQVIEEGGIRDRAIIQSFDPRALRVSKKLAPAIPVALLVESSDGFESDLEKLGFTPDIYSPYFRLVDEEMVRTCHKNQIRIIPWTVNEEEDMAELLDLGVDGLITDYPDVALTLKL